MAISDRLNKLTTDITNAYTSIDNKGGTIPSDKNTNNLPTAIDSIEVIEQQTAEGESLSLANTKAMPYEDYKVKGKSEQSPTLPEGYTQVEYIESTGTQYINAKFIPNQNTSFDVMFLTKNNIAARDYGCIFGSRFNSGDREYQVSTYKKDNKRGIFRINDQTNDAGLLTNTKMHIIYINNIYKNNIDLTNTITVQDFNTTCNLTIFALNSNDYVTQYGNVQLYNFKIYDNGTMIRNFIPCYRNNDNEIGLYDLVNDEFYTNRGTGTFLKGNNVSDVPSSNNPININNVADNNTLTIKQRNTSLNNSYTFQISSLRSLPNGVKDAIEDDGIHRRIGKQTGTLLSTTTITLLDSKLNGAYMCNIKESGTLTGQTVELGAGDYEIIYELATEIIEPFTQQQATTYLDIIKTGSYEGTTNIYTDEDVKPTIRVEYYKKG